MNCESIHQQFELVEFQAGAVAFGETWVHYIAKNTPIRLNGRVPIKSNEGFTKIPTSLSALPKYGAAI